MISLPLVYTILALIAYTSSFWYLFSHLMSKRAPNHWFIRSLLSLGLLLHAAVLYNDMWTPMGVNYNVFNLMSFTAGLMLLLSLLFSSYRPVIALNLIGIPVAAVGLIAGFSFSQHNLFINQNSIGSYYFIAVCLCRIVDGDHSCRAHVVSKPRTEKQTKTSGLGKFAAVFARYGIFAV
jgi:ABC-type uncharacterized transport system permease subunit